MQKKYLVPIITAFLIVFLPCCKEKTVYKTLIITGQSNHNWKASSPVLKQILDETGLFSAEIVVTPEEAGDMTLFNPDFSKYKLVVLDYVGDSWSDKTKTDFVEYVRKSYKVYNGKDIIEGMTDEIEEDFKNMIVTEIAFYNGEIIKYFSNKKKLTKKQSENLYRYITAIPKESAAGFWSDFMAKCRILGSDWHKSQEGAKDYILQLLSKAEAMK